MRPSTPLLTTDDPDRLGRQDSAPVTDEHVSHIAHIPGRELPDEDVLVPDTRGPGLPLRLVYLVLGLALFVTALGLMKAGAAELIPSLEGSVFTDNAWSTLGLGWLGACLVLSGSPVAASSLALLDGGAIDRTQSFTMLTGSRFIELSADMVRRFWVMLQMCRS